MAKVLVIIDMQEDFVTGVLGSEAAQAVVPKIQERLEAYRKAGDKVFYTKDTHLESDYQGGQDATMMEARRIPAHCIKGTGGWEIVPALAPQPGETVWEKPSFLSLDLPEQVRSAAGDAPDIELCGVCTDICVVSNALALRAHFPGSTITVRPDCCAGTSQENHQSALRVMASCLVDIV